MLKLNKTVVKVVNRARQHYLWDKKDREHQHSLAAWELMCKPEDKGGLGVINLELQNDALLMKHLFIFFSHKDTPWVNMVWQLSKLHSTSRGSGGFFLVERCLQAAYYLPWHYHYLSRGW
jgi:hypothetical protein